MGVSVRFERGFDFGLSWVRLGWVGFNWVRLGRVGLCYVMLC